MGSASKIIQAAAGNSGGTVDNVLMARASIGRIDVMDISDPSNISFTGKYVSTYEPRQMAIKGDNSFGFATKTNSGTTGLVAFDLSGTGSLTTYSYNTSTLIGSSSVGQLVVDTENDVLYAPSFSGHKVVALDISDPTSITSLGETPSGSFLENCDAVALDQSRQVIFANNQQSRILYSFDVSDPTSITQLGSVSCSGNQLRSRFAYDEVNQVLFTAGRSDNSVLSFDVSDPSNMSFNGAYVDSNYLANIFYIYVDGEDQLLWAVSQGTYDRNALYDVSNPTSFVLRGQYTNQDNQGHGGMDTVNKRVYWSTANDPYPYPKIYKSAAYTTSGLSNLTQLQISTAPGTSQNPTATEPFNPS